jgi:carbonic anhydrase
MLTDKGELAIHGAWFDISTGELWVMNGKGDFVRPDLEEPIQEPVASEEQA